MKHIMLDLETLGTSNNAVILQIGACFFDKVTAEIGDTFSINISLEDSLSKGFNVDASTIYWWMQQSEEARKSVTNPPLATVHYALNSFNVFIKGGNNRIWSHSNFDFVILMNYFIKTGIKPRFHYRQSRDLRTLVDLAKVKYKKADRDGIHHNALDDCKFQVRYCCEALNKWRENVHTKGS